MRCPPESRREFELRSTEVRDLFRERASARQAPLDESKEFHDKSSQDKEQPACGRMLIMTTTLYNKAAACIYCNTFHILHIAYDIQ